MATRSYIGVRNLDASVDYIYCHYDGYPSWNGNILTQHYQDMDRVNALMKLGDLSSLGENEEFCMAYGRDRGEKNVSVKNGDFLQLTTDQSVDYTYIFDGDYWECFDTSAPDKIIDLYNKPVQQTS